MHQQTPTPINPSPKGFAAETPEISHTLIHSRYECILTPPANTTSYAFFNRFYVFIYVYLCLICNKNM